MTRVALHCRIAEPDSPVGEFVPLRLFELGAEAVAYLDGILVAGFDSQSTGEAAASAILDEFENTVEAVEVRPDDASWVDQQRDSFVATSVPPFSIRPPWVPPDPSVDRGHDLIIDPGAAFGHGGHPSTQLAMTLMLRRIASVERVVDVGTGTGVLAIAAARCGATVVAIDTDPIAIEQAAANIAANDHDGIRSRISLVHGELDGDDVTPDDLVVANLTLGTQRMIADHAMRADRVILAGLLAGQIREVRDLYRRHSAVTIRCSGDWAGVDFSAAESDRRRKPR